MRVGFLCVGVMMLALPALAFSPKAPVQKIMDQTVKNWSGNDEFHSLFDENNLTNVFSVPFATAYREAAKNSVYAGEDGEGADPFGFDVITNSQDGCPLEDLKIEDDGAVAQASTVIATFKVWACMEGSDMQNLGNEVQFKVINENGRAVIDDIVQVTPDETLSIRDVMSDIAKEQQ